MTRVRGARRLLTLVALVAVASCSKPPEPIHVSANQLTVDNRMRSDWSDVEVWVNDHYRVTLPRLLAGQRFIVPLDTFVAGFGQRFNYRKQVVQGVEVTAKSADGQRVKLVWGRGRRR